MSMLSRVAERIYWMARYLERAETTSRLARVNGNLLLDLPREAGLSWDVLVQITGGADRYRELHPSPSVDAAERFFVADRDNPSSVRSSLALARESVRTTRDIVPSEAWRSINELCLWVTQELDAETSHRRRYGIHSRVVERCQQISGLLADTMSHDAALPVLPPGPRHRARRHDDAHHRRRGRDAARPRESRALRQHAVDGRAAVAVARIRCIGRRCAGASTGPTSSRICSKDTQFPRAIAFSLREIGAALAMLPRSGEPIKKLGDLRRMLTLRDLGELSIAELASVDRRRAAHARRAARARRGDVVPAVEERSGAVAGDDAKPNAEPNASRNPSPASTSASSIAGAVAGAIIVGGGFGTRR